jgi:hypothetical protein
LNEAGRRKAKGETLMRLRSDLPRIGACGPIHSVEV